MKELAYRVYPSTPESVESLKYVDLKNEVHIVLAFATGKKNGKFVPCFNPSFTPKWIREFKNDSKSIVKVFLSIGGRNEKYPFQIIPSSNRDEWVRNAIDSLNDIVKKYGFNGIDVYYEHIAENECVFAKAIWKVISALKLSNENDIVKASLTVSAPHKKHYEALYKESPALYDHVVYQSHSEADPISTVDDLVQVFDKLRNSYPNCKIFAGHSILPSDWKNVPQPIFFGAILKLHEIGIDSISKWAVTDHDRSPLCVPLALLFVLLFVFICVVVLYFRFKPSLEDFIYL